MERFTEEIIQRTTALYRNNPWIKKEEVICQLKNEVGLTDTPKDFTLYDPWQLGPETFHKLLVKIVDIVKLLEGFSQRLTGRKRFKNVEIKKSMVFHE